MAGALLDTVENTGIADGSAGGYEAPQQYVGFLSLALGSKPFDKLLSNFFFQASHELGFWPRYRIDIPEVEFGV